MPPSKADRHPVRCPHCGHEQPEARGVISTVCKRCQRHFRPERSLDPGQTLAAPALTLRPITCFDCGTALEVAASAQSTMCKRCSCHIDLLDYRITHAVSRNFKTKGRLVIEAKGYVLNSEAIVGDADVKGRFLGKLTAEGSLTVHSSTEIRGSFTAGRLVVPAADHFRWPEPIRVKSAEIAGELAACLEAVNTIHLRPTARMFGDLQSRNLIVEDGAVVVGSLHIGDPL